MASSPGRPRRTHGDSLVPNNGNKTARGPTAPRIRDTQTTGQKGCAWPSAGFHRGSAAKTSPIKADPPGAMSLWGTEMTSGK